MGGRGNSGTQRSAPSLTRTQRMVNRIVKEVEDWIDDSYMDEYDKESVHNWHDLLEQLGMTAAEAKETIVDSLESDIWDKIRSPQKATEEDLALSLADGDFEDENGNFLKYGDVMKLVKAELKNRGIFR